MQPDLFEFLKTVHIESWIGTHMHSVSGGDETTFNRDRCIGLDDTIKAIKMFVYICNGFYKC